jgi:Flp pilus assembly protein TadD
METYSVSGWVSDAQNQGRIESARVELHAITGGIVGSTFSRGNGDFEFDNVPEGVYTLVVQEAGYETAEQQVQVEYGSVFGVDVELRRVGDPNTTGPGAKKTVSVRELSIPRKAHDSMEKGLALLYGKSNYQGSLKEFQKAIQQYPDYYEAYAQMGVAYLRLGDKMNSEKSFRQSIDMSHEHYADAYYMLADLFSADHRFAEAEPLARKAVDIDSTSWEANSELARALLGLDRPKDAETNAIAAVKLNPNGAPLYLLLADVHIRLANQAALLDDLNHYLKLAPKGEFAEQARKQRDKIQQELDARKTPTNTTSPPKE